MHDLLICIRCHEDLPAVLDTVSAYQWACPDVPICFTVDANPELTAQLHQHFPESLIYLSPTAGGWRQGWWLLCNTLEYLRGKIDYSHMLCLEYDTTPLVKGFHHKMLDRITSNAGLMGRAARPTRWKEVYLTEAVKVHEILGPKSPDYYPGETVASAARIVTAEFIKRLFARGLTKPPYSEVTRVTELSCDSIATYICKACGLDIVDLSDVLDMAWRPRRSQVGRDRDSHVPYVIHTNCRDREDHLRCMAYYKRMRESV
jgi:hypothetical protein